MNMLKYISADDEIRVIPDLRQRAINDKNSETTVAREESKAEGATEKAIKTILFMLSDEIPVNTINIPASVEEIQELQASR